MRAAARRLAAASDEAGLWRRRTFVADFLARGGPRRRPGPSRPRELVAALVQHGRSHDWQKAVQLLRDCPADAGAWHAAAAACAAAAQWRSCLATLEGRLDDTPNWNVMMAACQASAQWRVALAIYSNALHRGRLPPRLSLLSACERGSAWHVALQILAAGGEDAEKASATVMSACSRALQWQLSLSLLDEVCSSRIRPDARSLTTGITACERGRKWPWALTIFTKLAAEGKEDVVALNATLGSLAGHWWKALELVSGRMADATEGTYHALLGALEVSSRWWHALDLFYEAQRKGLCGLVGLNSTCSALEKERPWVDSRHLAVA
ncbi:EMB2076 [Symbiodinium natans]|uniref:EMB2076 protein n=1 Tax=Symbiodinium natans TaxID=878477 RepID=A0A812JNC9_9DINO|nr:EMB2076 [Symbiodinium natans]